VFRKKEFRKNEQEKEELQHQLLTLQKEMLKIQTTFADFNENLQVTPQIQETQTENEMSLIIAQNTEMPSAENVKVLLEENRLLSMELKNEVETRLTVEKDRKFLLDELKETRDTLTNKLKDDTLREWSIKKRHEERVKKYRLEAEANIRQAMEKQNAVRINNPESFKLKNIPIAKDKQNMIVEEIHLSQQLAKEREQLRELFQEEVHSSLDVSAILKNLDERNHNYHSIIGINSQAHQSKENNIQEEKKNINNQPYDNKDRSNKKNQKQEMNSLKRTTVTKRCQLQKYHVLVGASSSMMIVDPDTKSEKRDSRWVQAQSALESFIPHVNIRYTIKQKHLYHTFKI